MDKWGRQVRVNGEIGEWETGKKEEEKLSLCASPFARFLSP
jgi:hypothetical protein